MARRFLRTEAAAAALRAILDADARRAADENVLVARDEAEALHPWLRRWEQALREEGGAGTRVRVDALVDRAFAEAMAVWDRANPPARARDHRLLALDEIDQIEREAPELGELTRRARRQALAAEAPRTFAEAVRAFFEGEAFDPTTFSSASLPAGERVDARDGQPGRLGVPAGVLGAFDAFYRAEAADVGGASLHRGDLSGHAAWVVFCTTDGDAWFAEAFDGAGQTRLGARGHGDAPPAWDAFAGRVHLAAFFTQLAGYAWEEGLSEPEERAAAGQPPQGWSGELQVTEGTLTATGELLGDVDFGALTPSPAQRELAVAAFDFLWDRHLRHAAVDGAVRLGPRHQGVLTVGAFTRSTNGRTYLTADWRDIDDGSFVLYFGRSASGLVLRVAQFDN